MQDKAEHYIRNYLTVVGDRVDICNADFVGGFIDATEAKHKVYFYGAPKKLKFCY